MDPVNEETRVTKTCIHILKIRISEISSWRVRDEIRAQTANTWLIVSECNLTLSSMNDEPNSFALKMILATMEVQRSRSKDPSDQLWCHHHPHNPHIHSIQTSFASNPLNLPANIIPEFPCEFPHQINGRW